MLALAGADTGQPRTIALDRGQHFELVRGKTETTDYRGRHALKLLPSADAGPDDDMLAILSDPTFGDGTIEVDVAGAPRAGVPANMRGFIGLAFRIQQEPSHFELFYIRPTNARMDDQLIRNHTTQYVSSPDYGWPRLRKESPGVYESYVDVEAGAWTHLKIVVAGKQARLYVNGATQPCLIVNDLKQGESKGRIGLWAHVTTDAYFSKLAVR